MLFFLPAKCKRYSMGLFYIFGWKCWLNRIHLRWWWLGRTVISLSLSALSGVGFVSTFCVWTSLKSWKSPDSFRLNFCFDSAKYWIKQLCLISHIHRGNTKILSLIWISANNEYILGLSYLLIFIWENEKKSWSTLLLLIRPVEGKFSTERETR